VTPAIFIPSLGAYAEEEKQLVMLEPIKIFYCYAPQDKKLRDELEKQLKSLKRLEQITLRLNREILAGTNWRHVEDRRFQAADLILLLISPDFIHSDYHYGIEMHHALEKHKAGNVWVIPLILRPTTLWERTPIGELQALPKDGKAITERRNRETAFVDIVKEISDVVGQLLVRKQELTFAIKVGGGKFPKFTRFIGPLCITCGARNPLGVITCENCGDLLLPNTTKVARKVSSEQIEDQTAQIPFFSNSTMPDLTDRVKCSYCGTTNFPDEEFCFNCGGVILSSTGNTHPNAITPGGKTRGAYRLLSPNSQLQYGRYTVEKVLGQGGRGATVLAWDNRVSNKAVVIKELIFDSTDPYQRQVDIDNFKHEVNMLIQIDHPLVPTVTDSFQEQSRYFLVQEYVEGENLEDRMKRIKKPMLEFEVLMYISHMLDILDYLSQLKPPIVHRDIKPANIIIGAKDKRAYLVDFGIARLEQAIDAKHKRTTALGTPGYAPPEQYQGYIDSRSDLYALGATVHYLLTYRNPCDYPPFFYPRVRSINMRLTANVEHILEHALQINVNRRYQKAVDMKRDIDEILQTFFEDEAL
jgi:hypothetical protein